MDFVLFLLVFLLGLVVGCILATVVSKPNHVGSLRVHTSDPDGPYLFLQLEQNIDSVLKEDYVTLKVDVRDFVSHK